MKTFEIEYTVNDKEGNLLKKGKILAKNRLNEFDAKVKTEDFFKNKFENFGKLIIHSCKVENPISKLLRDYKDGNGFKF